MALQPTELQMFQPSAIGFEAKAGKIERGYTRIALTHFVRVNLTSGADQQRRQSGRRLAIWTWYRFRRRKYLTRRSCARVSG